FARQWDEVATMLPRRRSYFQADSSQIWGNLSRKLQGVPMRWEHQLFPGLAALLLVFAGIVWRPRSQNRSASWLYLWAVVVLVGMTFYYRGVTLYRLIWPIPGLSNVRVVTRLTLVLLWPMSFFIAYIIDAWLRLRNRQPWLLWGTAVFMSGLLMTETLAFNHATVKKADAKSRLDQVKNRIPVKTPQDRILIVAGDPDKPWFENELDAMLVAQDLGCPVMNGYSSNFPGNYGPTYGCARIPERIASYMFFAHITDESFYLDMVKRIVPIGFDECDRGMWLTMPSVSIPPKPFP
ncbi:MAG TPA: hypothetical protein VGB38_08345, partial [bacterium]